MHIANTRRTVALAGCLLFCGYAHSAVLVSNLSEPLRATSTITNSPLPNDPAWAAQSFATDANTYSLLNIRTILGGASGSPDAFAELRKDTGANAVDPSAGGLLTTFTLPSLAGASAIRTLTPDSAVTLNPNTTYWLILGVTGTGSYGWDYAEGNATSGPGTLGSYAYSFPPPGAWATWGTDNPYYLEVNVSAVPEPATCGLVGAALLACARFKMRRCV